MKSFFLTLAHAAVGGFASAYLAHLGGGGSTFGKTAAMAGVGSAVTSVLSLFAQSPVQSDSPSDSTAKPFTPSKGL